MRRVSLRPKTFLMLWYRATPGHSAGCPVAQAHEPERPPPCRCGWGEAEAARQRLRAAGLA